MTNPFRCFREKYGVALIFGHVNSTWCHTLRKSKGGSTLVELPKHYSSLIASIIQNLDAVLEGFKKECGVKWVVGRGSGPLYPLAPLMD